MENAPTLTMFRAQMFTKLNYERTLPPLGEIDLESVQDYTAAGIETVPAAEVQAYFQFTAPAQYAIEGMEVRRCPLYEHQSMELYEYDGVVLKMEPGYYYEFTVYYEEGYARYGIVAEADNGTEGNRWAAITVNYRYDGRAKQIPLHRSILGGVFSYGSFGLTTAQTEPAAPYTYAEHINRLHTDHPQVTLTSAWPPLPYVVWAVPLNEEYEPIWDGKTEDRICEDGVITLQEGLYYYNVTVTFDGRAFTECAFVANYSPTMSDIEENPLWDIPFLADAPGLTLSRPLYGTYGGQETLTLSPNPAPVTDRPEPPFSALPTTTHSISAPIDYTLHTETIPNIESVTVRRYIPNNLSDFETVELTDGRITLHPDFRYEIDILCRDGRVTYTFYTQSIAADAFDENNRYVNISFERNGEDRVTYAIRLGYRTTWAEQDGEIVITHSPEQQPDLFAVDYLPQLTVTGPRASIAAKSYAVAAFPLGEDGKLSTAEDAQWIPLPLFSEDKYPYYSDKQMFHLLEGSYYYEARVCIDSSTYESYVFIAHYDPQAEGGNLS